MIELKVIEPLFPPKQVTFLTIVSTIKIEGSVIVIVFEFLHPFLSVIVTS